MAVFRDDHQRTLKRLGERRPLDRIVAHYELERRLADRLRAAPAGERSKTYVEVYRELFDGLPDHPQKLSPHQLGRAATELDPVRDLLGPKVRYLELGCGDASVTHEAAKLCVTAYGVDVTDQLLPAKRADNFVFLPTSGTDIPVPDEHVDLIYSNNLMEHIHPDDAIQQLTEIYRALRPGGRYFCATPNCLTGPHDISIYFDHNATGFHLREYDRRTLARMFRRAGFRKVRFYWTPRGRRIPVPRPLLFTFEALFEAAPKPLRDRLARIGPVYNLLAARVVAEK